MCEQWQDRLLSYVNGTLSHEEIKALEQHLAVCDDCQAELEEWRLLAQAARNEVNALKEYLPPLVLPGNSRFVVHDSSPNHKPDRREDRKMFFSNTLRLPGAPRRLSVPLTLIAAVTLTLMVSAILIFNRVPNLSVVLTLQQPETPTTVFERYINEVWNTGNLDALNDLLAPEFTHYDAGLAAPIADVEALKAYVAQFRSNLPGTNFVVDQMMNQEEMVLARLTASGEGFTVSLTASARLNDLKLVEVWFDANALLETQLAEQFRVRTLQRWNDPAANSGELFQGVFTEHGFFGTKKTTLPGVNEWVALWRKSFPNIECTTTHIAVESDTVMVHYLCEGTFEKAFSLGTGMVVEPSGEQMKWENYIVFRLENGKAAEFWWYESNPLFVEIEGLQLAEEANK